MSRADPKVATVLALDTATPTVSVAVGRAADGGAVGGSAVRGRGGHPETYMVQVPAGRSTGALLPGAVTAAMAEAGVQPGDLSAIAVGVGPGPYTSLRVGLMFARAAAAALEIPVVGACSLDVVARGLAAYAGDVIVTLDARRREVYWARYNDAGVRVSGPFVGKPAYVAAQHAGVEWLEQMTPSAGVLAEWALTDRLRTSELVVAEDDPNGVGGSAVGRAFWVPQTLLAPEPLYLRRPDVMEPPAHTVGLR